MSDATARQSWEAEGTISLGAELGTGVGLSFNRDGPQVSLYLWEDSCVHIWSVFWKVVSELLLCFKVVIIQS